MDLLRNHADRAIARHMLGVLALVVAVVVIGSTVTSFWTAVIDLGISIEESVK